MMLEELRSKFLARFIDTARVRLERAMQLAAGSTPDIPGQLAAEMHAFVGEAMAIGETAIATAARVGEQAARRWKQTGSAQDVIACARALRDVRKLVDTLAASAAGPAVKGTPVMTPRARGPRVLVVDDSELNAGLVADALEDAGFAPETCQARDVEPFLAHVRRVRPALVLLDIQMKPVAGDVLCRELRSAPDLADVQVALLSGLTEAEMADIGKRAHAHGLISKGAGIDAVVERVRQMTRRGA